MPVRDRGTAAAGGQREGFPGTENNSRFPLPLFTSPSPVAQHAPHTSPACLSFTHFSSFFFFVLCFVCHFYLTPKSVRIPKLNPNPTTTKVSPARCSLCADSLVLAPTPLWAQGTLVTRQTQSPIRFRCGTIVYCVGFYSGA